MSAQKNPLALVYDFTVDYIERHRHPANAVLHIIGVPAAFLGIYEFLKGNASNGVLLLFIGYLLQYLGHRAQGNEVGEVTLIKKICKKLCRKERPEAQ